MLSLPQLILLLTLTQEIFTFCFEEVFEVTQSPIDYYEQHHSLLHHHYYKAVGIKNATIACSDLSSFSEVDSIMFFDEPKDYPVLLLIKESTLLTIPPKAFAGIYNISKLYLPENHIKVIEFGAFEDLEDLEELTIDKNQLSKLPNEIFSPLQQLEKLTLNDNEITQIDSLAFKGLDNLKHLELRNNDISVFEDSFFETLQRLEYLDLSGNPLTKSPSRITHLSTMVLSNATLTLFDIDLSNSSLLHVNLSRNLISHVDFSKFTHINQLDLSTNKIVSVTNLQMMDNATYLNLDGNGIEMKDQTFPRSLQELHLRHNNIKSLYKSLFNQPTELVILDLGFNAISNIEKKSLWGLNRLENLHLDHNNIAKLDVDVFHYLIELKYLDLSHNKIEEFQFGTFDSLEYLSFMDISSNKHGGINNSYVHGNKLVNLHEHTFNSLKSLKTLKFENNRISSFDAGYFVYYHRNLRSISLDKNRWNCKYLVNITRIISHNFIIIEQGESFEVENFHGIACNNRREFDEHHNVSSFLKRVIANGMENFLEKKENKAVLLENNKTTNSNSAVIAALVIQLIVSCLLLFIIILIFIYLKKYLTHPRFELSSQIELCPNL